MIVVDGSVVTVVTDVLVTIDLLFPIANLLVVLFIVDLVPVTILRYSHCWLFGIHLVLLLLLLFNCCYSSVLVHARSAVLPVQIWLFATVDYNSFRNSYYGLFILYLTFGYCSTFEYRCTFGGRVAITTHCLFGDRYTFGTIPYSCLLLFCPGDCCSFTGHIVVRLPIRCAVMVLSFPIPRLPVVTLRPYYGDHSWRAVAVLLRYWPACIRFTGYFIPSVRLPTLYCCYWPVTYNFCSLVHSRTLHSVHLAITLCHCWAGIVLLCHLLQYCNLTTNTLLTVWHCYYWLLRLFHCLCATCPRCSVHSAVRYRYCSCYCCWYFRVNFTFYCSLMPGMWFIRYGAEWYVTCSSSNSIRCSIYWCFIRCTVRWPSLVRWFHGAICYYDTHSVTVVLVLLFDAWRYWYSLQMTIVVIVLHFRCSFWWLLLPLFIVLRYTLVCYLLIHSLFQNGDLPPFWRYLLHCCWLLQFVATMLRTTIAVVCTFGCSLFGDCCLLFCATLLITTTTVGYITCFYWPPRLLPGDRCSILLGRWGIRLLLTVITISHCWFLERLPFVVVGYIAWSYRLPLPIAMVSLTGVGDITRCCVRIVRWLILRWFCSVLPLCRLDRLDYIPLIFVFTDLLPSIWGVTCTVAFVPLRFCILLLLLGQMPVMCRLICCRYYWLPACCCTELIVAILTATGVTTFLVRWFWCNSVMRYTLELLPEPVVHVVLYWMDGIHTVCYLPLFVFGDFGSWWIGIAIVDTCGVRVVVPPLYCYRLDVLYTFVLVRSPLPLFVTFGFYVYSWLPFYNLFSPHYITTDLLPVTISFICYLPVLLLFPLFLRCRCRAWLRTYDYIRLRWGYWSLLPVAVVLPVNMIPRNYIYRLYFPGMTPSDRLLTFWWLEMNGISIYVVIVRLPIPIPVPLFVILLIPTCWWRCFPTVFLLFGCYDYCSFTLYSGGYFSDTVVTFIPGDYWWWMQFGSVLTLLFPLWLFISLWLCDLGTIIRCSSFWFCSFAGVVLICCSLHSDLLTDTMPFLHHHFDTCITVWRIPLCSSGAVTTGRLTVYRWRIYTDPFLYSIVPNFLIVVHTTFDCLLNDTYIVVRPLPSPITFFIE